ncbi:MAG: GntR family transcriptional regulator [Eubacteriales bacterium]|nr:GntR family transcriptional regulator [Eubacteriales bacterium]
MSKQFLHSKIYDNLLQRILEGEFSEGNKLPPEKEIQNYYGVSRITVRRAIQDLQDDGYVIKLSGIGTIIKSNKVVFDMQKLDSFSNETKRRGIHSTSHLISFDKIVPKQKIRSALNLLKNEKVYRIERLRKINQRPIGVQVSYIVDKFGIYLKTEDFLDETASLYDILRSFDIHLQSAEESIEAIMPDQYYRQLLGIDEMQPVFYREQTTFDKYERTIEYVEMYYRSDEYKYKLKLQVSNER